MILNPNLIAGICADGTTDDTAALLAALQQAAANHMPLVLPPGIIRITQPITVTVQGPLAVFGAGRWLTTIRQDGPGNVLNFDLSQGDRKSNTLEMSGLSVLGNHLQTAAALWVDYGPTAFPSVEDRSMVHLSNLEVRSCRDGIYLRNVWGSTFHDLLLSGSSETYQQTSGPGCGTALTLAGCVSCQFTNVKLTFWNLGFALTQAYPQFGCQGILVTNLVTVEVLCAFSNNYQAGDNATTLHVVNFCLDNGNVPVSRHRNVELHGFNSVTFANGQMLQALGASQAHFTDCSNVRLVDVDLSSENQVGKSIVFDGSSRDSVVGLCVFSNRVPISSGGNTRNITAFGNVIKN